MKSLAALVLAAGQGKRMRSRLPKVLHHAAGVPLVAHVVRAALLRRCAPVVVVVDPKHGDRVQAALTALFPKAPLRFAVQEAPRGTGDAARVGLAAMPSFAGQVLVLCGDVPLLTGETLGRLEKSAKGASLAMLSAEVADATGYGRVVRERGLVARIVEHKDASPEERAIREINVGVYLADAKLLRRAVTKLEANNAQGELYLTDAVPLAASERGVGCVRVADPREARGVNTRAELCEAEVTLRARLIALHQARGVTFRDPLSALLGMDVELGRDVEVGYGVQLVGAVKVGEGTRIDGPTYIKDTTLAGGVEVGAFCHMDGAVVAAGARIGPFARLRPGARIDAEAHIGNFVEVKKSHIGKGAKANHLAYLGDTTVGAGSNIGAGTITCNYDGGPVKHPTVMGKRVFVGSNSTLVAPVTLGDGAYIAAGSTVTKDVPSDALAFGRARQDNRVGYAKRLRARTGAAAKTSKNKG